MGAKDLGRSESFNPRARVGRDHIATFFRSAECVFQSTRPRGARLGVHGLPLVPCGVSIHAPAWGATSRWRGQRIGYSGFNPRARVGRDNCEHDVAVSWLIVSIHAPAWGATPYIALWSAGYRRFNPRARVGRDPHPCVGEARLHGFNPRARVGRDRERRHTPTR